MGFLTTFTVYNDGCDQILKHPEEFAQEVYDACSSRVTGSFPVGNHGNLVKHQKTRHADEHTVYVHMGNTVCEMNAYSEDTINIMKNNPEYFKNMLFEMEFQVKKLKKLKELMKAEK